MFNWISCAYAMYSRDCNGILGIVIGFSGLPVFESYSRDSAYSQDSNCTHRDPESRGSAISPLNKTLDPDFVAPAPCHVPIEVVSVRVTEHPHEEGTPSGVVFWTAAGRDVAGILRRNERMKASEGGRRPNKGRSGTKKLSNRGREIEMHRWSDTTALSLDRCW